MAKEKFGFNVLSKIPVVDINNIINTLHYNNERMQRKSKVIELIGGYGTPLYSFIVDTMHPNGYEIHTITDKGIIIIQNEHTKKLITILIARAPQIKRYFNNIIPIEIYKVISLAEQHQLKGYNNL